MRNFEETILYVSMLNVVAKATVDWKFTDEASFRSDMEAYRDFVVVDEEEGGFHIPRPDVRDDTDRLMFHFPIRIHGEGDDRYVRIELPHIYVVFRDGTWSAGAEF